MATTNKEVRANRKQQILETLAAMLQNPRGEKITTAALAAKLEVSEAALYRHFANKAKMFEGLIEFIESALFGVMNKITSDETDGLKQVQLMLNTMLKFAERNPGMSRVLIGDALVNEDDALQARINQLIDRLEASIKQSLRIAEAQGHKVSDAGVAANTMMSFVVGRWHSFAKSGFKRKPSDNLDQHLTQLITGCLQ
ncbi:nucleoid occlusion factor SlmA [Methylophilus aquaticus]|uniref:Nucleoid occlusion factor SlmA n=1 Tax=Methylophilus aquaticus TaxID=1971610 RepID=A0ABT9JS90_9PROT|nr:nucleoid occlusion factor SlmA [Methylophilus aquaticus]MDP8567424.1 nucleoid occlusion factor SlmA [Methylophilus aquaticus]